MNKFGMTSGTEPRYCATAPAVSRNENVALIGNADAAVPSCARTMVSELAARAVTWTISRVVGVVVISSSTPIA